MSGLLGLGAVGWIVALVIGFAVGGVFFMSIKVQVDYVMKNKGPLWVAPAAIYARLAFVAAVLIMVALSVPRQKVAGAALGGLIGTLAARLLISRHVKARAPEGGEDADDG